MAKVTLDSRVTVGTSKGRIHLEAGEQEVTAEVEKLLKEAGLIEAKAEKKQQAPE